MKNKDQLWKDCMNCKNKCCCEEIAFPLFVTLEERKEHKKINTKKPCIFFNKNELCEIHSSRPYDCRFFPFELMKIKNKFYWIIWDIDCSITRNRRKNFEEYLSEHETNLIPRFLDNIENYAKFRVEELKRKYNYEILREARI